MEVKENDVSVRESVGGGQVELGMSIAVAERHDGLNKETIAFDKKNED
jgi:hypothetical protein